MFKVNHLSPNHTLISITYFGKSYHFPSCRVITALGWRSIRTESKILLGNWKGQSPYLSFQWLQVGAVSSSIPPCLHGPCAVTQWCCSSTFKSLCISAPFPFRTVWCYWFSALFLTRIAWGSLKLLISGSHLRRFWFKWSGVGPGQLSGDSCVPSLTWMTANLSDHPSCRIPPLIHPSHCSRFSFFRKHKADRVTALLKTPLCILIAFRIKP